MLMNVDRHGTPHLVGLCASQPDTEAPSSANTESRQQETRLLLERCLFMRGPENEVEGALCHLAGIHVAPLPVDVRQVGTPLEVWIRGYVECPPLQ